MIEKLLTSDRVLVGLDVHDVDTLIDRVGDVMVAAGDVEVAYIAAMKNVIKELGPYCVITPGVALLHARPDAGIKRLCIALATTASGVEFGSANDPVFVAFALGATDHESHIELLAEMARLLENKANVEALKLARTPEEILDIVGRSVV